MNWDAWVGHPDGTIVMLIKNLLAFRGRRVQAHRMIAADLPGCYHTHPAFAIRIVLWHGYVEEVYDISNGRTHTKRWRPGMIGLVRPSLAHRIAELPSGPNVSLWLRGRVRYPIMLMGDGWPPEMRWTSRTVADENLR